MLQNQVSDFMTISADDVFASRLFHENGLMDCSGEEYGLFRKDDLIIISRPKVMRHLNRFVRGHERRRS
ncbi:MAG: hypothetical protein CVV64_11795 [Candidatus Wallbacteria bacterium HGW-Wallbacteria-1]|uniref:Uncharacterized protein n=1 Tax=Candidatus Wallbacteria bacterium HGW-Wallbacteria-1 TaxID=2013854 RepID=A0A2N1PNS7_9BACT|nr:MAG: hypothetical protein CVV64_11795 [Candidatus Wallbacteria bacterium HGW-Wallbacteria-1]